MARSRNSGRVQDAFVGADRLADARGQRHGKTLA